VLESTVERRLVRMARKLGGLSLKLHMRGIPDRLILLPFGVLLFVETKQPDKKPRADQLRTHAMLRRMGYCVLVCDGTDWPRILYMMRVRCKLAYGRCKKIPEASF
jgi:hypothetical protein